MSKLTSQPNVVIAWILLILSAALLAHGVGYMLDDTVRLEGSTQWCLEGEYGSLNAYQELQGNTRSFIDFIGNDRIRVFIPCDHEKKA